jgi:hypothetical protein
VKFIERIKVVDETGRAREIRVWQDGEDIKSKRLELEDGAYVRQLADDLWEDSVRHRYRRA